jgi:apolipoprotein N-acyltransferase
MCWTGSFDVMSSRLSYVIRIIQKRKVLGVLLVAILGTVQGYLLEQHGLWPYLIILNCAVLFLLWRQSRVVFAWFQGLVFGVCLALFTLRWLWEAANHFGVDYLISSTIAGVIIGIVALIYSLSALMFSLLARFTALPIFLPFVALVSWMTGEWLISVLFGGLPYLQVGFSLADTVFSGFYPILGSLGTGAFAMFVSGGITALIFIKKRDRFYIMLVGIFGILPALGYALHKVKFTTPVSELKVRVLNGTISKENKEKPHIIRASIQSYVENSKKQPHPDLVIWPESSIPNAFFQYYRDGLESAFQSMRQHGTRIVLGTYFTGYNHNGIHQYNALVDSGNIDNRYYKRHLVLFGEYMPQLFQRWLPSDFLEDISPGNLQQEPLRINQAVIAPLICFELMFPSLIDKDRAINILVNASNLSWFGHTRVADKMAQIARVRAMEFQKPLLRSDNYGRSLIVDYNGTVLESTAKEAYIEDTITLNDGQTPYAQSRNFPLFLYVFSMILIGFGVFSKNFTFDNKKQKKFNP